MEDEKKVDESVVTTTTEETEDTPAEKTNEESQSPIKKELDKVKGKTAGKTELEKALFTKQQIDKRIKELSGEEGIETPQEEDDDTPVTVGTLRKMEKEKAQKTALTMAEEITDADEKELVMHHIQNTIRPSGNPAEDLRLARAIVNSVKNTQILEEVKRKPTAKTHSSGSGAPARQEESFEPTKDEQVFMSAPFNLTKEQVIAARKKAEK
jgi:hypothetical protein